MKKTALKFIRSLLFAGFLLFVLSAGSAGQDFDLSTRPAKRDAGPVLNADHTFPVPGSQRQQPTDWISKYPSRTNPVDESQFIEADRKITGTTMIIGIPINSTEELAPEMPSEVFGDPDKITGTSSRLDGTNRFIATNTSEDYWFSSPGGFPNGAVVTNLRYTMRIDDNANEADFWAYDYEIWLSSASHPDVQFYYQCVYDNLGSSHTDQGYDDDVEDDSDIWLNNRSSSAFNGETVDQAFVVRIQDNIGSVTGNGIIDYVYLYIDWEAPDPNLIADYTPSGWPRPVVMSEGTGNQTDIDVFYVGVTYYIDFAIVNRDQDIETSFYNELWTDYTYYDGWMYSSCQKDYYMPIYDVPMTFTAGDHWIAPWGDATDLIVESNESDNWLYRYFTVYDKPAAPDLYTPSDYATCQSTSLTLDWEDLPEAETYHVIVDNNADWSSPEVNSFGVISSSFYVTGLSSNDTYYWAVQGDNPVGLGFWSDVWEFTTAPGAPASPTLSSPSNGSECVSLTPTLDWNSSSGAASYHLQVDDNSDFSSLVYDVGGLGATEYTIPANLSQGVPYYWRVAAVNACGTYSGWSSVYNFTPYWTPDAPVLSSPSDAASCQPTSLALSWGSVSGATSYQVMVDDNNDFSSPEINQDGISGTSYTASGLASGTTCYWIVRAYNSCGVNSAWSAARSFTTVMPSPGTSSLSSPSDGSSCEPLSVDFSWGSASNADHYILQVDNNNDFSSPVFSKDDCSTTSQTVSGLGEATTYYWHVKAVNGCGTEGSWSSANDFSTTITSIGTPSLSSPADAVDCQPTSLTLSWTSASNADGYDVQVDNNNDFSSPEINQSVAGTSYNCSGLSQTTTYYWRVKATGMCSMESAWTASRSFETGSGGMAAPTLIGPANSSTDQALTLTLSWNAVADAVEYHVQMDDNSDFSSPEADELTSATSFEVTGLDEATTYYWHVQASGDCASGGWSDTWGFETEDGGTPVDNIHEELGYSLEQNFPNPFSEASLITFTIPVDSEVSFDVYTPQGKLVRSESQFYPAGKHSFELRANKDMRAGVYLYRMRTDDYTSTRLCVVR